MRKINKYIRTFLTYLRVLIGSFKGGEIKVGKNSFIEAGAFFSAKRNISIGDRVYIGRNSSLSCHLIIEDDILIASNVAFVGGDHKIDFIDTPINRSGRDCIKPINIQKNVWVGHGATILHGVTLHTGCVVAAGAVVTKDVPANAIVGGNPAQIIRYRKF